jgi:tetratricopeptide (TPR) repeat protein
MGYYYLGLAYRLQKQDDGALTTFEKALSLDANLTDALSQIAAIYMAKGDTATALKRVQRHVQVLPNNPLLYNLLGGIYTLQNNDAKAEEAFKQAIKLDENVLISYLNLGNLYVKSQSYEQAIRQYEAVIKANPTVLPPYMLLGVIYDLQGKHPKANEYYQEVLKINPRFGPAANNLAWNYAEHGGNIDVALSLAQTAKEQLPDVAAVSDTLGWIYYKKHVYLKAISLLQESVEKLPDNPIVHYHLGMAYFKKGDRGQAKEVLAHALQLSQAFPGADQAKEVVATLQ